MRELNLNQPDQRTLDWHRARLGNFTGSSIAKLMGVGRKKDEIFSQTAIGYLYSVASERMLSDSVVENDEIFQEYLNQKQYVNRAMQFGIDNEENARLTYELQTGFLVDELPSVAHETIEHYAASPDGCVKDEDIVIEIKCPKPETFARYKACVKDAETLKDTEPNYYWQVMAEMDCTGTKACDFICYCPFMTEPLHVVRINRNDEDIAKLHERISLAEQYINDNILK